MERSCKEIKRSTLRWRSVSLLRRPAVPYPLLLLGTHDGESAEMISSRKGFARRPGFRDGIAENRCCSELSV
jgi:hypothetical protein